MLQTDKTMNEQMYVQVTSTGVAAGALSTSGCVIPTQTADETMLARLAGGANIIAYPWHDQQPSPSQELIPNPTYPGLGDLSSWIQLPTTGYLASPWRVSATEDQLTIAIDLPGVRLNDLSVVIDKAIVKVTGQRFDNKSQTMQTYVVPATYDAKTATAVLDSGVLTVQFSRAPEQVLHKVSVKGTK